MGSNDVEVLTADVLPLDRTTRLSADNVQDAIDTHLARYMRSKDNGHYRARMSLISLIEKFSLAAPHSQYYYGPYHNGAQFGLAVVQATVPEIFPIRRSLQRATLRELGKPGVVPEEVRRRNAMDIGMIGLAEIPRADEVLSMYAHKVSIRDLLTPTDEYSINEQISAGFGLMLYVAARSLNVEGQALPMTQELLQLPATSPVA